MRFLDRKWIETEHKDPEAWLNLHVYQRHLEDIADDLPRNARALAALSLGMQLKGAEIAATTFRRDDARFTLVVQVPTLHGVGWLEIEYQGVEVDDFDPEPFEEAESLLTDEFDLAPDGLTEHRLLFKPKGEGRVRFKDLQLKVRVDDDEEE